MCYLKKMNKNNKLNPAQILVKAGQKYRLLKLDESRLPHYRDTDMLPEIRSDQIKAVVEVLCEEINKILENK